MTGPGSAHQNVTFPSNGGHAHGYIATPPSGRGPGLIVIQEWWGLTDHIAALADRFAAEGFVALAPDLYGGRTTHDAAEAGRLMQELPPERAAADLSGAVDCLLARDDVVSATVGAVGFCMGGGFVLTLAVQQGSRVSAAVPFYPAGPTPESYRGLEAAVQAHFGARDDFVPADKVEEIRREIGAATGSPPEVHVYPAAHAFLNDGNLLGTYDREQAELAWERTVQFLRQHVTATA